MKMKSIIITLVLLIIPFFYVLFFLKAFWDPYKNISNLPVAIVNLDSGEIGSKIIKNIEEANAMKIISLEDDELAKQGVKSRKYYASVTLPENLTKNTNNLKKSDIIFRSNKKNNYIAAQIYEKASEQIQLTLKNEISSEITSKLYSGIKESVSKTKELNNGITTLKNGSDELKEGITTLNSKYGEFDSGIESLDNGIKEISAGLIEYTNAVNTAANGLNDISNGVVILGDRLKILKWSDDFKKLYDGAKKVQTEKVKDQLVEASSKINNGISQIKEGSEKLNTYSKQIKDGIGKLEDGSILLNGGLNLVSEKVTDSYNSSQNKVNSLVNVGDFTKTSINLVVENIDDIPNYGSFFAPYFISISLWIGALVIMVVMYYDQKKRFYIFDKDYENKYIQYLSYFLLVILQSLILTVLISKNFDFEYLNFKIFLISVFITNVCFFNMIYFFIILLDDIGKFVSIMLLIIQISSSAGTFPIETTPEIFVRLFPFIPMRYSINVFKESLAGYDKSFFVENIRILICLLVVFTILNIVTIILKKHLKIKIEFA